MSHLAMSTLPHISIPIGVLCASASIGTVGIVIIGGWQEAAAAGMGVVVWLWRVVREGEAA